MRMHRDFGMIMRPEQMGAFKSNSAVAERRPLRAARDNADVLRSWDVFLISLLSRQLLDLLQHRVQVFA